MPFTTSLNTIRVYGTLGVYGPETATTESADAVVGSITFTPSATLVDVASNQVLYANPVTVTLNASDNGALSVRLAATDDPQITPTGWHWTAVENFTNAAGTTFTFNLPVGSPSGEVKYASIRGGSAGDAESSTFVPISEKGAASGVASLDGTGKVPTAQLGTGSAGGGLLFLADDRTFKSPGVGGGGDPTLSGDVTGLGSANTIATSAVTSGKIAANAVTTAKIADANVTAPKVADASLTTAKLAAGFTLTESQVSLASDAAAGTPSRRSLGTGATQAAAGNHPHTTLAPKTETIRYFDHGADPTAARPTGYAVVFWGGTVPPDNLAEDDFWNDPAGMAVFEDFIVLVTTGNPFGGGVPGPGSYLLWNTTTSAWEPSASYAIAPTGEEFQALTAFGPVWGKHDTRRQVTLRSPGATADTWALTTTKTELLGATLHRVRMDLRGATNARISVNVSSAAANGQFRAEYSVNDGSTWAYLTQAAGTSGGTTPNVSLAATGTIAGAWGALHANAQVDTALVRIVGLTTSGSASVSYGNLTIETR